MGGIGYITAFLADISRNNILINVNMLEAAQAECSEAFPVFVFGLRVRAEQTIERGRDAIA